MMISVKFCPFLLTRLFLWILLLFAFFCSPPVNGSIVGLIKVGEPQVTLSHPGPGQEQEGSAGQGVAIASDMMRSEHLYVGDILKDQWHKTGFSLEQWSRAANLLVARRYLNNVMETKVPIVQGVNGQHFAVGFVGNAKTQEHFARVDTSRLDSPQTLAQLVDDSHYKAWEPRLQATGMKLEPQEFLMTDGKKIYGATVGRTDYGKQRQGPIVQEYEGNLHVRGWNPQHFHGLLAKAGYDDEQYPAVKRMGHVETDLSNAFRAQSKYLFTPNDVSASWSGHVLDSTRKKAHPIHNIDMQEMSDLQSTPERPIADIIYNLKKNNLWDNQLEARFDQQLGPYIREANDRLIAEREQRTTARNPAPPQVPSRARWRSRRRSNGSSRSPSPEQGTSSSSRFGRDRGRSPSVGRGGGSSRRGSPSAMGRASSKRIPPPVPPKPRRMR